MPWPKLVFLMIGEFLEFSKSKGNDLSTPMPQFGFPGLKAGDQWCLCALRWEKALVAGCTLSAVGPQCVTHPSGLFCHPTRQFAPTRFPSVSKI